MRTLKHLPRASTAGFTMVELMVAMVIAGFLMVSLVQAMLRVQGSWDQSQERAVSEQNTRGAMYMMVRDLRMAGSGFGGRGVVTGGVPDNAVFPVNPAPAAGSDTLRIVAGMEGVQTTTTQTVGSPGDLIYVADASDFVAGDFFVITNGVDVNMFRATGVDAGSGELQHTSDSPFNDPADHSVWPNGGYPTGSRIVQVEVISYWLDRESAQRQLMRRVDDDNPIPVAWGVNLLDVRFRMADGSLTDDPANPGEIHAVELRYVPRRSEGASPTDTLAVTIQPRVMG